MISEFQGEPLLCGVAPRELTNVADALGSIHIPTLIYNGEHDMPDFRRAAAKLASDLPDVKRATIPSALAFPACENARETSNLIQRFVHGSFLLREGDHEKEVEGFPALPEKHRKYLLNRPIKADIVHVGRTIVQHGRWGAIFKITDTTLRMSAKREGCSPG